MLPVTGTGLLSLLRDFEADGRTKADTVLAAGYRRANGKPANTAFYEALLKARGVDLSAPPAPQPPGSIPRHCGDGPAIYVACLASYNAGKLFGSWLDLSDGPDAGDIRTAIDAIIKESPEPFAEEYAIHDNQELPGILSRTEWPDIDQLANYCQNWAELQSEDDQLAYRLICDEQGAILDLDAFRSHCLGWYERPESYAMEWADNAGLLNDEDSNPLLRHVDWESVWRDLHTDGFCASFVERRGLYLITC